MPWRSASIGVAPPRTWLHSSQCVADARLLAVAADRDPDAALGQLVRFAALYWSTNWSAGAVTARTRAASSAGGVWRVSKGWFQTWVAWRPIGIAGKAAIGDDQGRVVADLGLRPEAEHVLVEALLRDVVLERRIAVLDQGDVHLEQRAALGHDEDVLGARGGDDLLALVAARLVVILDRMGALRAAAGGRGRARRA